MVIVYGLFCLEIDGATSRQTKHESTTRTESAIQRFSSASDAKMSLTETQLPKKVFVLTKAGSLKVLNAFEQFYDGKKNLNVNFRDSIEKRQPILFINTASLQVILFYLGNFRFFENVQKYFENYQQYFEKHSKDISAATIRIDTQAFEFLLLAIKKQDEWEKPKKDEPVVDILKDDPKTGYIGKNLGKALYMTGRIAGKVAVGVATGIPKEKIFDILWELYERRRWNKMGLLEKIKEFVVDHPEKLCGLAISLMSALGKIATFVL
ncbi:MAG: hypothetical protein LBJ13_00280 [Puniceicoccales bacterium]|jgi:hypothetical protein|nr:hypothetical protein [Puniceicoccales bacterium]